MIAETTLGALAALGAAMLWAVTSLLVRSLMAELGSVAVNAIRTGAGGVLLLVWVLATGGPGALTAMSARVFALLALSIVAAIAVGDTVFFESTKAIGLGRAMTISMSYPVGAAVLAAVFLGEPLTLPVAAGALLTLGGLTLIVAPWTERPRGERFWPGVGMATLASLAWAVAVVLLKAPLQEVDPVTAQAVRLPLAAVVLGLTPWARGALRRLARSTRGARVRLAALGILTAVSAVLFVASVKYAGVAAAAVLSSTAPMFAIPLGWIFLGERLSRAALLGAGVTVAGIVVLRM